MGKDQGGWTLQCCEAEAAGQGVETMVQRSSLGPGLGLTAEQGGGVERNPCVLCSLLPCLAVQEIGRVAGSSWWQRSGEVGLLKGEAGRLGHASASPALCCSMESLFCFFVCFFK